MRCAACREAVSAGLDGESPGVPQQWVDEHLAGCAACRGWAEAAAEVTRRARLTPVDVAVPDVTAAVLARLPGARVHGPRRWVDIALRVALLAAGIGQLAVGLPALDGGGAHAGHMAMPVHLSHETGAWNLALAACFLGVAALPRLAAGALPFLLSFAALLGWVTFGDLRAGHVPADRAVAHLLLFAGAVLVSVLAWRGRTPGRGPVGELLGRFTSWREGRDAGRMARDAEPLRRPPAGAPAVADRRAA
ncbi:zf-HC2 domain-containing protein [Modestobacter sp. NPDC049651]|uniref:zf-HC2 domain-containing protein n=1 Tax=unclassified Modestobacter TaxID=2643866 RepID=UPI0033D11721